MTRHIAVGADDLGNGFNKISLDGEIVRVDPSVYAIPNQWFGNDKNKRNLVSVDNGEAMYIGQDAYDSGLKIHSALGDSDVERYEDPMFRKLLFGFIAREVMEDVEFDMFVVGLPVSHYALKKDYLEDMVKGKTVVRVGDEDFTITIKNCVALPQPIGTHAYLQSIDHPKFDPNGNTLVNDGGFGTFDNTLMKGLEVVDYFGNNLGMKQFYMRIQKYLEMKYGIPVELKRIPEYIENGFTYGGVTEDIRESNVYDNSALSHFEGVYDSIVDKYGGTDQVDQVVWSGGMSVALKEQIMSKGKHNFIILEEGQDANVLGYHAFGMGLIDG